MLLIDAVLLCCGKRACWLAWLAGLVVLVGWLGGWLAGGCVGDWVMGVCLVGGGMSCVGWL